MNLFKSFLLVAPCAFCLIACAQVDLYEKTVPLPNHEWKSDNKPEFSFVITDTSSFYKVFFVMRHTEKYNYNNIWINLYSQPAGDTMHKVVYEIKLATNEKGWLGTGIDDIYEHRLQLTGAVKFRAGVNKFILENIMREDPLKQVLNVGIRIEKLQ